MTNREMLTEYQKELITECKKALNSEFNEVTHTRKELIKKEIDDIIKNPNRNNILHYLESQYDDLINLDRKKYPETYNVLIKSFNQILKDLVNNEQTREHILSGENGSHMYHIREEIITNFSGIIDEDIIVLFSKHIEALPIIIETPTEKTKKGKGKGKVTNDLDESLKGLREPNAKQLRILSRLDKLDGID